MMIMMLHAMLAYVCFWGKGGGTTRQDPARTSTAFGTAENLLLERSRVVSRSRHSIVSLSWVSLRMRLKARLRDSSTAMHVCHVRVMCVDVLAMVVGVGPYTVWVGVRVWVTCGRVCGVFAQCISACACVCVRRE